MEPRAARPSFPEAEQYGAHGGSAAPLRPWSESSARLAQAGSYWLVTSRRDGRPHTAPIGAVWVDDRLWLNTDPTTLIARTLARDPRAIVHLESADDVLIVHGVAARVDGRDLPAGVVAAYEAKYGGTWDPSTTEVEWSWFSFGPTSALAWGSSDIRNSAVRYDFPEPDPTAG